MDMLLYITITFTVLVKCSRSDPITATRFCSYDFDEDKCSYEVNCTTIYDIPFHLISQPQSSCSPNVIYQDSHYFPINVVYKGFQVHSLYGSEMFSDTSYAKNVITSLDLSDGEYSTCPVYTSMENLRSIKLSFNSLTVAILSNRHSLDSLTELDFSHNTIDTITVNIDEYPYRSLIMLNMSHNYLVTLPDIFHTFFLLQTMDLSHNFIDTLTVLTFEGLKNLVNLYLSNNRISDIDKSLLRFNKLKELDLSNNQIESINRVDFEKLSNLRYLNLRSNSIHNIETNTFESMYFLTRLDLSNNKLNIIDKEIFLNLNHLHEINLSNNNLKILPSNLLKGKNVILFSVEGNSLEGSIVKGSFEGLRLVTELDLSNQQLSSVEDFAFFGLEKLVTISLNNNVIRSISNKSFNTLHSLDMLDLSNNQITNIEFEKEDLISLRSLLLQNNHLTRVTREYFMGLNNLIFLDLSNNKITQLESRSFTSLKDLLNFHISNNPIEGTLEEGTFAGLNSLPTLTISGLSLNAINNSSFKGMTQLKDLNISRSNISDLQFNTFSQTGAIEIIDLSFNQLSSFKVNTADLSNLNVLILNNNQLAIVSSETFKGLTRLSKLILSHNKINVFDKDALSDQTDLRNLDVSYNTKINFEVSQIVKALNLVGLYLSGIQSNITFKTNETIPIAELEMSYSKIYNITAIQLKCFPNLNSIVLSNNNIIKVEVGAFNNINRLRMLDLSFNKISFIQPGVFKDNPMLHSLNISHNLLGTISYGIFRGLIFLQTVDISFNELDNLQSERFYEVRGLSVLIADHNRITSVNAEEFAGTALTQLSIGGNPLPCDTLVNLKRAPIPFIITAIQIDERNSENVDGITCNMQGSRSKARTSVNIKDPDNNTLLDEIKYILQNLTHVKATERSPNTVYNNTLDLSNITNQINKVSKDNNKSLSFLSNLTSAIVDENNSTNMLLGKMLKVLISMSAVRKSVPIPIPQYNSTATQVDSIIPYVNKIKQDLEDTIAIEKQKILNEIDNKYSYIHKKSTVFASLSPNHEALSTDPKVSPESRSLMFIEISVGIILTILVAFILYHFLLSRKLIPSRNSYSTRNLPDAMENSTL